MTTLKHALQAVSVIAGLLAAWFWWRSTKTVRKVQTMPANSGQGDTLIKLEDGTYIHYANAAAARLNQQAALWTAVSVACQAIGTAIPYHHS